MHKTLLILCIGILAVTMAQATGGGKPQKETKAQFLKRTQWWRDARFGMFIHWGVYSVPADGEWHMYSHKMQVADYEKYAPQFNPVNFDAHKWVKAAKDAGMKYIVITSKHHDGFAMFDSQVSDYTLLKRTPFKRDPLKELAAECKKQGMKLCFYHSIMDWHHPDYLPRRPWDTRPAAGADLERYVRYLKAELKELLTNYGPIGILWFDGEWEDTWNHDRGVDLYNYVRSLQPNIIINNRVDSGRSGMSGMSAAEQVGDYGTPEQEIPARGYSDGRLWESCMTMNDNWGYSRNDHNWKSPETLIHNLCDIASKGGNFLLNVGPTELGELTPETMERLVALGKWMDVNSASIYGTSASPFSRLAFEGRCTTKGNSLFLQVYRWPEGGLKLEGLKTAVVSAHALAGGGRLPARVSKEGVWTIGKPATLDPYATVIEVKLAGKPVVEQQSLAVHADASGKFVMKAADAEVHGTSAHYESGNGKDNIGFWSNPKDFVTWECVAPKAGDYSVEVVYACEASEAGSQFYVAGGDGKKLASVVESTGTWTTFKPFFMPGKVHLKAGKNRIKVGVTSMKAGAAINLRAVILAP